MAVCTIVHRVDKFCKFMVSNSNVITNYVFVVCQFASLYKVLIGECISAYRNVERQYNSHHLDVANLSCNFNKCLACPKVHVLCIDFTLRTFLIS